MSSNTDTIRELAEQEYKWGFVTDIGEDRAPKGLNEDIIRLISTKKNEPEFMLEWRLKAFRHWESLEKAQAEPKWANVHYPPIDYQDDFVLLRAQAEAESEEPGRTRSGDSAHLRKAGHSARRTKDARGRCRGRGVR